jgi:murein DD-endopeptidase MepM/ murein hydrolase activator NlpD
MRKIGRRMLVLAGFVLALITISSCSQNRKAQNEEVKTVQDTIVPLPPVLKYGLPIDSFSVTDGVVKTNQYLSQILNAYGVGMGTIDQVARKSKSVFDVRKIRSGQNYTIFQTPDSLKQTRYFVYENSPTEYYVFELFDSLNVYKGEKDVVTKQRTAQGVIETSLWNTMDDSGLDPMLALDLNDIYQWTIDFYAIQKGDRFRLIYDEQYVDSVSIGIGNIYAVEFDHFGEPIFAFRFLQDGRYDYFDENGKSLRKAFLKAPLHFSRISSRFSNSRMHPVLRIRRPHHGVDYAAAKGTPVMSIGDGNVIARGYQKNGGGNYVKIRHNSLYTTSYMHLSGFAKGIAVGKRVKQGEVIGYVGATGLATGPHLDFRVYQNGTPVDPLKVKSPPVEPVEEENVPQYTVLKDSLMNELQNIEWQTDDFILAKTK